MSNKYSHIFEFIHKCYQLQRKNKIQLTSNTKIRSEISGGGRKPWKQKGTGRARAGSIRSPIWRGGGVVFGPRSIDKKYLKINKQEKKLAKLLLISIKRFNIVRIEKLEILLSKKSYLYKIKICNILCNILNLKTFLLLFNNYSFKYNLISKSLIKVALNLNNIIQAHTLIISNKYYQTIYNKI